MALTKITSTNIQPGAIESSALELSGAAAGTYGSSSQVPVLSVNAQGIVYAISTTAVAGVDDFTWNGTNETLTIDTSDGSSYTVDISEMASETYVDTAISNLIGGAPAALDTLNELAAAINDDASYAASITTSLGTKVDKINITGATVGSSTAIPVLTFNAQGQITSASTTTVAGIDDVTFTNGTLTISAGDGTDYTTDLDARYFTETEANANFLGINAKAADADLFDGLNSTQFLRSDADDTMSGSLRINTGTYKNIDIKPLAHQTVSDMGVGLTFSRTTSDAPLMALGVVESDRLGLMSRSGIKFLVGATNNYEYTSEAMFIDPDGKVGIGETSPISKLDVVAGNSTAGDSGSMVSIKSAAGNTVNKLNLGTSSTGDYAWIQSVKPGSDVKSLAINPNGGNVGIGDTTPSYKLDVNGTIRATTSVIQNGSATGNFVVSQGTSTQSASIAMWGNDHASYPGGVHIVANSSNASADSGKITFWEFTGSSFVANISIDKNGNLILNNGHLQLSTDTVAGLDANAASGSLAYVSDDGGNLWYKNGTAWKSFTQPLGTQSNPAQSAQQIVDAGDDNGDGIYWFKPEGYTGNAFQVYCDMTNYGGGWMIVSKWYQDAPYTVDELYNANARNANTTYLLNGNQPGSKSTHSRLSRDQTNALWNQSSHIARIWTTEASGTTAAPYGTYFQKKITNTNNFDFWNAHYSALMWSDNNVTNASYIQYPGTTYKVMRYETSGNIFTDGTFTDFNQPSVRNGPGWWDDIVVNAPNYGNIQATRHMGFYGDIYEGNQWLLTGNPSDSRFTSQDSSEGKRSIVYLK